VKGINCTECTDAVVENCVIEHVTYGIYVYG